MPRKKLIARHMDMIVVNSSNSVSDDHGSLGADQEHAPETLAVTLDASSSSAMSPRRGGFLSQQNPFTRKYQA